MYELLLLVGFLGFLSMTALGALHGGHGQTHAHGSNGGHAHGGHVHTGHHSNTHVPSHHGDNPVSTMPGQPAHFAMNAFLAFTPLDIFAYCLGAGATGMTLRHALSNELTIFTAIIGALLLNFLIIKPLMKALMMFASKPSDGLEGLVAHTAEVVTKFDRQGRGLVKVLLDDEEVQLLASLQADEVERGVAANRGDKVSIVEVDAKRNRCTVTRDLDS